MKKMIILGLTVSGLTFSSVNVFAKNDDSQYPAANFQPKVVYIDEDAAKEATSMSGKGREVVFDPNYPAANFQPKVIYINEDIVKETTPAVREKRKMVFDPKYPAAYFEPKVIYP